MRQLLKGGRVWRSDGGFAEDCPILLEDGRIAAVGADMPCDEVVDVRGLTVLPGLVDVHTHGRSGFDFSTATRDQMRQMKEDYARAGVTTVFATLASATPEEWLRAIGDIQACGYDGIHLEGRFLNPSKRGAHAPELLVSPDARELERYLEEIHVPCHLSAAFELDGSGEFAACARRYGVTMGLGHTAATAAQARLAMERGVTSFTHLFNAMPPLHHREGGAVGAALLSADAWAELIVDGLHICPDMVQLTYRCKANRLVLITDSMEATGCADGEYAIAGQKVIVRNGRAETLDGALAGSTLNLWDGVKNLMRFAGASLSSAVACATLHPAQMTGIDQTVGSVDVGKRADLLLVDDALERRMVFAAGRRVL